MNRNDETLLRLLGALAILVVMYVAISKKTLLGDLVRVVLFAVAVHITVAYHSAIGVLAIVALVVYLYS